MTSRRKTKFQNLSGNFDGPAFFLWGGGGGANGKFKKKIKILVFKFYLGYFT